MSPTGVAALAIAARSARANDCDAGEPPSARALLTHVFGPAKYAMGGPYRQAIGA